MIQKSIFDLSLFPLPRHDDPKVVAAQKILKQEGFDVRQRSYESEQTFVQRQITSAYALDVDYYNKQKWCSIKDWVDIAPKGTGARLPSDKRRCSPHECYYIEIKSVQVSDWQIPQHLKTWNAQELPARANYILRPNDILLSRFKEPPGKCVIFLTEISKPVYASSNFILLRTKLDYSVFALLAFLKSSFGLCQLNHVIRRRTVTAEMYIYNVSQIALPMPSTELQNALHTCGKHIIEAELSYRNFSASYNRDSESYANSVHVLNEVSVRIDELIRSHIEQ